jgi:hypothetical protein
MTRRAPQKTCTRAPQTSRSCSSDESVECATRALALDRHLYRNREVATKLQAQAGQIVQHNPALLQQLGEMGKNELGKKKK